MAAFLLSAALFILAVAAVGLARLLRGPTDLDRIMSAQLIGAAGIAVLLLLDAAGDSAGVIDVALLLALMAAFAAVALARSHGSTAAKRRSPVER